VPHAEREQALSRHDAEGLRSDGSRQDDAAIVDITMDVRDKKQLDRVIAAFRRIPGVRDIERIQHAP